tara:strand:+ start:687 stop:1478 length:792 start_codon:yes stop_codon:yes gene_type:complete
MSSAVKALKLLSHFSATRPEIGLSQLCRIAGRDKSTTYRYLQALEIAGFVEQNSVTKQYRLGPTLLQLAQVREETIPRKDGAKSALSILAGATGETAHVTVLSGKTLYGLCDCEPPKNGIRAVIDLNIFPLHATASGLCALAFGPTELFEVAAASLIKFTETTPIDEGSLVSNVRSVRTSGFGYANQSYEAEIQGVSAPLFDHHGLAGTVAVACVASRFSRDIEQTIKSELVIAARDITRSWGGKIPSQIEGSWASTLSFSSE